MAMKGARNRAHKGFKAGLKAAKVSTIAAAKAEPAGAQRSAMGVDEVRSFIGQLGLTPAVAGAKANKIKQSNNKKQTTPLAGNKESAIPRNGPAQPGRPKDHAKMAKKQVAEARPAPASARGKPHDMGKKPYHAGNKPFGRTDKPFSTGRKPFDGGTGKPFDKKAFHASKGKPQDKRRQSNGTAENQPAEQEPAPVADPTLVGVWHELEHAADRTEHEMPAALVERWLEEGRRLLAREVEASEKNLQSSRQGDLAFMKTIMTSGTMADKVAALMLRVQDSPLHNLQALDSLLAMAQKKSRREALVAVDTLRDLWLLNLLPERKLLWFAQRPLNTLKSKGQGQSNRKALLWYFEHALKERYETFINKGLKVMLTDPIEQIKSKGLATVHFLLSSKPEQETLLLSTLVNELGNPTRTVASKAGYFLRQLLSQHPNMSLVVTTEVQQLLHRPNVGLKARYYAVCFLNQFELSRSQAGQSLTAKLLGIYFDMFQQFVTQGEIQSKFLSALLAGVNRAFPFLKETAMLDEHIDTLFRVVNAANFNCSVQALLLLLQILNNRDAVSDRFYKVVYEKMLHPEVAICSKSAMFLNVVLRAMKLDPVLNRLKAFVKRLLQVCQAAQPPFVCGAIMVLSQVVQAQPGLQTIFTQAEDTDEEEHFVDAKDTDIAADSDDDVHNSDHDDSDDSETPLGPAFRPLYNPFRREPQLAGAQLTGLWEIHSLLHHYHPSVVSFTKQLIDTGAIAYPGDPLKDLTIIRFLDRFVFKNPKQAKSDHGGSLMQPQKAGLDAQQPPVNTASFWQQPEHKVQAHDMFFFKYFQEKARRNKTEQAKGTDDLDGDIDDIDNETDKDQTAHLRKQLAAQRIRGVDRPQNKEEEQIEDDDAFADETELDLDDFDASDFDEEDDEEMLDLEKIAREGFGESDEEEDDDETAADNGKKSIYASAEDFAEMLEDQEPSDDAKELMWAQKRSTVRQGKPSKRKHEVGAKARGGRQQKRPRRK